tara:strand:- start:535 stop:675 length:141 start_codon:yes stop_codon:yes gene_type:complete
MTSKSPFSYDDELTEQINLLAKAIIDIGVDEDEILLKVYLNDLFKI